MYSAVIVKFCLLNIQIGLDGLPISIADGQRIAVLKT